MKKKATNQHNNESLVEAIIEVLSNDATPAELRNDVADSLSDVLNETQVFDLTPENLRAWLPRAIAKLEQLRKPTTQQKAG